MKIIDISLPIYEGMPVYPGTAPTKIKEVKSGSGQSVLSELQISSHVGTHVDAPAHAMESAELDDIDLETFYGPAKVIDLNSCEKFISTDDLKKHEINKGDRVLFKTKNSLRGFKEFYDDFVYLDPEAAEYLADTGVILVGIDSLSIKQRGASNNDSHLALLSKNIPILEGIDLSKVEAGEYRLAAFPIKLQHDGAPTRAVLIDLNRTSKGNFLSEAKLFTDGGSRGNPGPSAAAYVICKMDDTVVEKKGTYIGITTNNQAEYQALKAGLKQTLKLGVNELSVYMDSELVIKQINGLYKIKNTELLPHYTEIKHLATKFSKITFQYVPRALNAAADKEVNRILNEQN